MVNGDSRADSEKKEKDSTTQKFNLRSDRSADRKISKPLLAESVSHRKNSLIYHSNHSASAFSQKNSKTETAKKMMHGKYQTEKNRKKDSLACKYSEEMSS